MADKTLQKLGINVKDINGLIKTVQTNAACDSDCREEKRVQGLYNTWQGNRGIQDSIPEKVKSSHKEWYIAVNGEQAYNNYLAIQQENNYSRRGLQRREEKQIARNEKNGLDDKITNLEITYQKLRDYKNKLIKENQILEINLDRISGDINKNNRMFDYENIEIKNILSSRYIVLFLYYALFIIYILFGNFKKNFVYKNKKILFFIILYSIFPFLINYILYISYGEGRRCRGASKGGKIGECNFLTPTEDDSSGPDTL
jgi:hypothetical protein